MGIMAHFDAEIAENRLTKDAMLNNLQAFFKNKDGNLDSSKDVFSNMVAAGMGNTPGSGKSK
jgi:hypothetical protein